MSCQKPLTFGILTLGIIRRKGGYHEGYLPYQSKDTNSEEGYRPALLCCFICSLLCHSLGHFCWKRSQHCCTCKRLRQYQPISGDAWWSAWDATADEWRQQGQ